MLINLTTIGYYRSRLIQDNLKLQDDLKKYTFNSGNDVEKSVFSNEINENEIKNLRETLRQYEALNSLVRLNK